MESVATWIAALVAVGVLLWELHRVHVERRANVTSAYLQRFWEIDDDLLIAEKGGGEHRRHRHRYLKLCEDEFEAARTRILDYRMWHLWHGWLATEDMKPRLADDLATIDSDGTRFEHLRACLDAGVDHGWTGCPARLDRWYDWIPTLRKSWG